ncbi:Nicotinate dehydrogenase small FeS subunit [Streptomyces sp. YIM 130001]|uniref:2Fe-2S iron-sulfur cluster-binding protein n=1 Tax=Streptomyces sp. YIM 130001 TaxID=2259644 RepID=UPI000EC25617|nr:(2Fe-2S)-binding protein [Streptomyces sp. YIM 130001]RII19803.1 Nicotinate dehydrogenase small FeS subunit [Streptomyces sp. YIM 130001]
MSNTQHNGDEDRENGGQGAYDAENAGQRAYDAENGGYGPHSGGPEGSPQAHYQNPYGQPAAYGPPVTYGQPRGYGSQPGEGGYGDEAAGQDQDSAEGGWQPTPQGAFDADATAFVQLPEGYADIPLAAPGSGFVPPPISVAPGAATDPAATGAFIVPNFDGPRTGAGDGGQAVHWPEPNAPQQPAPDPSAATGSWSFTEGAQGGAPFADAQFAQDAQGRPEDGSVGDGVTAADDAANVTGQWSIPVARGDLPDESGEFTRSALVREWAAAAPATLPGGAPAPWAPREEPRSEPRDDGAAAADETASTRAGRGDDEFVAAVPEETGAEETAPARDEQAADDEAAQGPGAQAPQTDAPAEDTADEAQDPAPAEAPQPAFHDDRPLASYVLSVNEADRPVTDAWIGESLLYVLRERLGLAGAKDGCSQGECGACAVQVDGRLVASCLVPAATTAGSEIRTVEGLAADGRPSDVQRALTCGSAVQCGFCIPGMAMTVHDLLAGNPDPSEREARQALSGNLCRCTGYRGVLDAVSEVVAERRAASAAEAEEKQQQADAAERDARIPHQAPPGAGSAHPGPYGQGPEQYPHDPEQYPHDGGQA